MKRSLKQTALWVLTFITMCFIIVIVVLWVCSYQRIDHVLITLSDGRHLRLSSVRGTVTIGAYKHSGKSKLGIHHDSQDVTSLDRGLRFLPSQFDLPSRKKQPWLKWGSGSIATGSDSYSGRWLTMRYCLAVLVMMGVLSVPLICQFRQRNKRTSMETGRFQVVEEDNPEARREEGGGSGKGGKGIF